MNLNLKRERTRKNSGNAFPNRETEFELRFGICGMLLLFHISLQARWYDVQGCRFPFLIATIATSSGVNGVNGVIDRVSGMH